MSTEILDSLSIGIIILDRDFRVLFRNNWILGRFDPHHPIKVGERIPETGEPSERFLEAIAQARDQGRSSLLSGKLNKLPFHLIHGGIEMSYNLIISRISFAEESHGVLVQIVDVTQVKQREQFLIEKQNEIDQERANSFNKERLVSLGELSSSIAHEINNPLAILEINYRVIEKMLKKKDALFPELTEVILQGKRTIDRVSSLIIAIKNLARNPKGNDISRESLDTVIQDVYPVFLARAHSDGVELRYDSSASVFNVRIDCMRTLLGQVFVNLFNNSFYELKKHDEKWIELSGTDKGDFVEISFTDSGKGIPVEIQEKIFLPFYTTKDVGQGTGLGLSTVFKIIEGHQGSICIDSSCPNTRFIITLPKVIQAKAS